MNHDRQDELNTLEQLLAERHRPVPPAPRVHHVKQQISHVMRLIATALTEETRA